jgi:hypothetical protein
MDQFDPERFGLVVVTKVTRHRMDPTYGPTWRIGAQQQHLPYEGGWRFFTAASPVLMTTRGKKLSSVVMARRTQLEIPMSIRWRKVAFGASLTLVAMTSFGCETASARTIRISGKTYYLPDNFNTTAGWRNYLRTHKAPHLWGQQPNGRWRASSTVNGVIINPQAPVKQATQARQATQYRQPQLPRFQQPQLVGPANATFPRFGPAPNPGLPHFGGGPSGGRRNPFAPSDIRVKRDITLLGHLASGLGLYRFRYVGHDQVFIGVMAQEVLGRFPRAVAVGEDGYLRVNYRDLGLRMQTWEEWTAATRG